MQYLSVNKGAHKILRITERMMIFAEHGDWETFAELEKDRSESMDSLFQHPDMPKAIDDIVYTLRRIMEIDKRCIELGERDKQILSDKMNIGGSEQAIQSYLQCAG